MTLKHIPSKFSAKIGIINLKRDTGFDKRNLFLAEDIETDPCRMMAVMISREHRIMSDVNNGLNHGMELLKFADLTNT